MTIRGTNQSATSLIEACGQRATRARVVVMETLLAAEHALTHEEIQKTLARNRHKMDRVTLYRVLDWATNQSLVHKMTGEDRAWRFSAVPVDEHAHFNCTHCGQVYCLESRVPTISPVLPSGFKLEHAEVSVHGLCPECNK